METIDKMDTSEWLFKLIEDIFREYEPELANLGIGLPSSKICIGGKLNVVFTGGMYVVTFMEPQESADCLPKRVILDCVCGVGKTHGTRISTIVFINNGKVESIEIVAERHEWPIDETEFVLTKGITEM
ncbi:MAG: hypothetical protein WCK77_17825 [Verrucomicrobiota bacterium]